MSPTSSSPSTLVELLRQRALRQPGQTAYTFLADGETEERGLTYAGLDRRARAIGAWLQAEGAAGRTVLLMYPPGPEFIAAFFGCLYARAVGVPSYPPRPGRAAPQVEAVAADAGAQFVLTSSALLSRLQPSPEQPSALRGARWAGSEAIGDEAAGDWREPAVDEDTLAFLQYTSGSTSAPKGVMVSHRNILENQRLILAGFQHTERSLVVSWLPLFHDMGLIGKVLQPIYLGVPCVLMSPLHFLQRPARWLQAVSRYRATTSGGPNFAYDLCVRRVTPEQRAALDLSSWDVAFSGAEPVRAETLERFAESFAACGFRREAFYPCYGLAEATLIVSGGKKEEPPVVRRFQESALEMGQAVKAVDEAQRARSVVGCGRPLGGQRVVIADTETLAEAAPGRVGEVWVSGPCVAQGYWNKPELTEQTFRARLSDTGDGPFLRTGDLGFVECGELFITGRLKDLLIIRGQNYAPEDIEWAVGQSHAALRQNVGAAFTVERDGEERLVVLHELSRPLAPDDEQEVRGAALQAVAENFGLHVSDLRLLKAGSIRRTSSGKVRRHACRADFLAGLWDAADGSAGRASIPT